MTYAVQEEKPVSIVIRINFFRQIYVSNWITLTSLVLDFVFPLYLHSSFVICHTVHEHTPEKPLYSDNGFVCFYFLKSTDISWLCVYHSTAPWTHRCFVAYDLKEHNICYRKGRGSQPIGHDPHIKHPTYQISTFTIHNSSKVIVMK